MGARSPQAEDQQPEHDLETEVSGLARGGGLNLLGAVISQLVLFVLTIILARVLGHTASGVYFEAFAFFNVLGLLSLSGFRGGLTRFVAVALADADHGLMRGTIRFGLGITIPSSVVLAGGLYLLAPFLAVHGFHQSELAEPLQMVALAMPASSFMNAALSATQGFRTMRPYALVGLFWEPAVRLGGTIIALAAGFGLDGAMKALVVSNWTAAIIAGVWLKKLIGAPQGVPRVEVRSLLSYSMVSWAASLASTGLIWADTLLLGIYKSAGEVSIYNVSTRLVMLATFVMTPITASLAPRVADLTRRKQMKALDAVYKLTTSWIVRLSLPAFVFLLVLPHEALEVLFGKHFIVGASATVILACGQLFNSVTGPCGVVLNMSGRPALNMIDNVGTLVANVLLNLWLIPAHGIVGSAFAWALSLTLLNTARLVQVKLTLGVLPFNTAALKGVAAALGSLVLAIAIHLYLSPVPAVVVGILVIGGSYVLFMLLLGLTEQDQMVLRSFLPGRGTAGVPGATLAAIATASVSPDSSNGSGDGTGNGAVASPAAAPTAGAAAAAAAGVGAGGTLPDGGWTEPT